MKPIFFLNIICFSGMIRRTISFGRNIKLFVGVGVYWVYTTLLIVKIKEICLNIKSVIMVEANNYIKKFMILQASSIIEELTPLILIKIGNKAKYLTKLRGRIQTWTLYITNNPESLNLVSSNFFRDKYQR